jgi:ATP-dependent Clp protease ATP-binding subunit ClpC
LNVLLQVFEDGVLTDSTGEAVDCKNAIFIMTSNIGARFIQKRATLGFQTGSDASRENMEQQVMSEVKKTFAPEFINRLDEIIVFDELTDEDLIKIIDLQVEHLNEILAAHTIQIRLTLKAKRWLIDKTCADRKYGARPLKRALQRYVEDELSESLIQGKLEKGSVVEVCCENGKMEFRPVGSEETEKFLVEKT